MRSASSGLWIELATEPRAGWRAVSRDLVIDRARPRERTHARRAASRLEAERAHQGARGESDGPGDASRADAAAVPVRVCNIVEHAIVPSDRKGAQDSGDG